MAGSAALFFAARPRRALLADINPEVVTFYQVLRSHPEELAAKALRLKASRSTYYRVRASRPRSKFERAVKFLYLNRLCWNGVYRVNRKGDFNVPMGNRLPSSLWSKDRLLAAGSLLKHALIREADFEVTARLCRPGDIVFFDPPYARGASDGIGFDRYTASRFSDEDHARLARTSIQLHHKGVYVLITVAARQLSLYPSSFQVIPTRARSLIAGNGAARGEAVEFVLRNYTS
jgi:DNA adenine methylase